MQSFSVCSSVAPFHSVRSFRDRLLQGRSLTGHSSCQENCSFVGSPRLQLPSRHVHLLWEGASMEGYFLQHVPPQAAEKAVSGTCSTLLTLMSAGYLPHFFQFSLTAAAQHFLPFLRYVSTGTPPACLKVSALGNGGFISEPDRSSSVQHRGHPHSIPLIPTAKALPLNQMQLYFMLSHSKKPGHDSLTRGELLR